MRIRQMINGKKHQKTLQILAGLGILASFVMTSAFSTAEALGQINSDSYGYGYGYNHNVIGEERAVVTAAGDQYSPKQYGNKLFWIDQVNGRQTIKARDLKTGEERIIDRDIAYIARSATWEFEYSVYGNKLIWLGNREENTNYQVHVIDLRDNEETTLIDEPNLIYSADIFKNFVVYAHWEGNISVYKYNLKTDVKEKISPDSHLASDVRIFGRYVIWQNGYEASLYLYDLSAGSLQKISGELSIHTEADIWGNFIAFRGYDRTTRHYYLYVYDIAHDSLKKMDNSEDAEFAYNLGDKALVWDKNIGFSDRALFFYSPRRDAYGTYDYEGYFGRTHLNSYKDRVAYVKYNEETGHDIYIFDISKILPGS